MDTNFVFESTKPSNMHSNTSKCALCEVESSNCRTITEPLFEFEGKYLTTLDALEIFKYNLFDPAIGAEKTFRICSDCGDELEKCFSFAQKIIHVQQAITEDKTECSEFQLSSLCQLEANNTKGHFRPILPKKKHILNEPTFLPFSKPKRAYNCPDCPKICSSFRQLKVHTKSHELDNISICIYCCCLFANTEALESHNNEKHADKKFVCLSCNRLYKLKGHLLKHILKTHQRSQLIYYCSLCSPQQLSSMYNSKLDLKTHFQEVHLHMSASEEINEVNMDMNEEFLDEFLLQNANENSFQFSEWDELDLHLPDVLHINQQPEQTSNEKAAYRCPNCYEHFENQKTLFVHLTQIHMLKFLVCNICDAKFQTHEELCQHKIAHRRHDQLHPSESNLCKICDKTFKSIAALNYHVKTHSSTGVKSHACPYCGKLFLTHKNLKQHLRNVHVQIKKHVCQLCDKQFATLDHLRKHVLSQHQGERKHSCQVCSKRFNQLGHLKQHLEIHTIGKKFYCKQCCASFWRKVDLERHILKHANGKS